MEYSKLLDLTTELGYRLAMSGAETFRVEESVIRILKAYDIEAEVFAIPNCLHISIEPVIGRPLTRMRRIGDHEHDLDAVERYTNLSRRICAQHPDPEIALSWLKEAIAAEKKYSLPAYLGGHFLGAFGFALLFGAGWTDALLSGVCGIIVGAVMLITQRAKANSFFRILISAFLLALPAYALGAAGIAQNADMVIIGALMILVPGLLFTNAMRDIIYGDTNSGINRIVQVLLIAVAIALGTACAWSLSTLMFGEIVPAAEPITHALWIKAIACFIGCFGFLYPFNIHGPGGLLCAFGGVLTWFLYWIILETTQDEMIAFFWSSLTAALYAEIMARIRKYPAISYLVISIFPLLPGAGVYYAVNYGVKGQMEACALQGSRVAAIAGILAVAILLGSTTVGIISTWRRNFRKNKNQP